MDIHQLTLRHVFLIVICWVLGLIIYDLIKIGVKHYLKNRRL